MIKGKLPFPFQVIALAVSFSPELRSMIGEMKRLCNLHNSKAIFIHIGKKTGEKHRDLSGILTENGFHDGNSEVYWESGEVVSSILRICKEEIVDLLLIGASEKESFIIPVGPTASNISTKAKCCSVLVYSNSPSGGFRKIAVNGIVHRKTDLTLKTAIYFAEKENSSEIFIAEEGEHAAVSDESGNRIVATDSQKKGEAAEKSKVVLNFQSLASENYSNLSEYAFRNGADLLITHSSNHKLLIFDRIASSNGIESLLRELPCNILIVHSRLPE